ncbi:alpha-2,8-sialyltransferase 8E-like [Ptychodera flava]|uniref:alpha-2,8-sialyltransferase 8E-like n=1 Tax=Ptychodera flava TaxID=63121 RepID=UPI003969DCD1
MKKVCGFRCRWSCHAIPNLIRILLLILICYCIVVTLLTIYSRLSPIRRIDDRRLRTSSSRTFSCHSNCNETNIQVTPKIDITNATVLTKHSKIVVETSKTSKPNVKTDGSKPINKNLQSSKQLIRKTSEKSEKNQQVSAIDVYKSIKADWTFNATAAEELRCLLEKTCKTSEMCFTSQESVKINDSLKYMAENGSILITSSILNRLPKESPYTWNMFKKCSIVGSSGILLGSQCGKEIDSADFIVRFNLAKTQNFTDDVGGKTSLVTCNPSVIRQKYFDMSEKMTEKFRQDMVTEYGNTTLYIQAFHRLRCVNTSFRSQDALESAHMNVVFPHPSHWSLASEFWHDHGIESNILSSGLMLLTSFLSFCQEVHLFGFWPFQESKHGTPLPFHYYDPTHIPRESRVQGNVHNMPSEFNLFIDLHNKGIIRLHVDKC